ncbi:sigma factor [Streptomyces sp. 8K308]|uniref:RNA polymerase sigma factor n=1 Tax=Streptomyces sp. 8K308 TaxID=2530388 RepID=UPI001FB7321A|nr:sigma factor [Streptomyces sp. 8K308]
MAEGAEVREAEGLTTPDALLAVRAGEGDAEAFETLVRRHLPALLPLASRLLGGDRAGAEEVVQEAFVEAWRRLPEFRGQTPFPSWMRGIVTNRCRRPRRARRSAAGDEGVTATVMELVRREPRPGGPDEGAAARVLRAVADALPGVRAGGCRISPVADAADRGPLRVRLEVAAGLNWTVPELAGRLREEIVAAARDRLGLDVRVVDIAVVDLLLDHDHGP